MNLRIWNVDEMMSADGNQLVQQSDELDLALGKLLFGKHPSVQFLSLVTASATWVSNHDGRELQEHARKTFHQALDDLVELKRKEQQT
jgi:hypothetical protein